MRSPWPALLLATIGWNAAFWLYAAEGVHVPLAILAAALLAFTLLFSWPTLRPLLRWRWRSLLAGLAAAALLFAACWLGYRASGHVDPRLPAEVARLYALLRLPPGPQPALLAVVILAEEVIWRGLALSAFERRARPAAAIALSALAYALAQAASGSLLLLALAAACGALWAALRRWSGDLLAPFVAHFAWDLAVFVSWPLDGGA